MDEDADSLQSKSSEGVGKYSFQAAAWIPPYKKTQALRTRREEPKPPLENQIFREKFRTLGVTIFTCVPQHSQ